MDTRNSSFVLLSQHWGVFGVLIGLFAARDARRVPQ
jgi:hypothetical protein